MVSSQSVITVPVEMRSASPAYFVNSRSCERYGGVGRGVAWRGVALWRARVCVCVCVRVYGGGLTWNRSRERQGAVGRVVRLSEERGDGRGLRYSRPH